MAKREWLSRENDLFRTPSGMVYARPTVPGMGRKEISLGRSFTGAPSELDAKLLKTFLGIRDRKLDLIRKANRPRPASMTRFEDLATEILKEKVSKSKKTLESAELHFDKHLIPWFNEHYPYLDRELWKDRGETLWQEYIDSKRAENPRMKFLNHRKHLRMVLLRAFERGILARKVKLYDPDPEIDVGQVLTHAQVKRLYRAASPQLKIQIMMAFSMGFRKSEILRLEWERVDFQNQEIILRRQNTKTRKPRTVPMNPWVIQALTQRRKVLAKFFAKKNLEPSPYVFFSRYDVTQYQRSNKTAWQAAKRRAKVDGRFHDLRHTFITNAVRAGMNPILICKYAGVSQEVMAKVYCHLDTNDLRQVAGSIGGKLGEALS